MEKLCMTALLKCSRQTHQNDNDFCKELKRMSFMALAVMMLAGGFLLASGKSQHVMPKKAVADITETVPETGTDEIVAGDEEVPL